MRQRFKLRWTLTRRLYEAGYRRKDILELYRLIDWLLSLPPELGRKYKAQVIEYESAKHMPYVTSTERFAREEGLEEGLQRGLERGLEQGVLKGELKALQENVIETLLIRFGPITPNIRRQILKVTQPVRLKKIHRLAVQCGGLAEFKQRLRK